MRHGDEDKSWCWVGQPDPTFLQNIGTGSHIVFGNFQVFSQTPSHVSFKATSGLEPMLLFLFIEVEIAKQWPGLPPHWGPVAAAGHLGLRRTSGNLDPHLLHLCTSHMPAAPGKFSGREHPGAGIQKEVLWPSPDWAVLNTTWDKMPYPTLVPRHSCMKREEKNTSVYTFHFSVFQPSLPHGSNINETIHLNKLPVLSTCSTQIIIRSQTIGKWPCPKLIVCHKCHVNINNFMIMGYS